MTFLINPFRFNSVAPDLTISGDGVWTWFNDPRAIAVAGEPIVGAVNASGVQTVYYEGGNASLTGATQVDDHNNPAFLVRLSDSKILAFASKHNDVAFYRWISTNANDATSWGSATDLDSQLGKADYAYANVYQLDGETNDPIYLFFRASDGTRRQYWYSTSTDSGATFATATQLLANNLDDNSYPPYVKIVKTSETRLDFFCTDGHPRTTTTNSIYHFYYEGGVFKTIGGSTLTLPITPATHLTGTARIYNGATNRAWIWDCAVDGSGNPVCVYATFHDTASEDHRYRYAKWNGSSWTDNQVCTAGRWLYPDEARYSGGITIDRQNVNRVFASRVFGVPQLYRYETSDSGASWTETQLTNHPLGAFRPYMISGVAEPRLAYLKGRYTTFTDYDTDMILTDSTAGAAAANTDPYWAYVRLMVDGQGADGSTTFTDLSGVGRTLTANGNVQNDTGISIDGGTSILFDGTGDFISAVNSPDLMVATSTDFCIEARIYVTSFAAIRTIADMRDGSGAEQFSFQVDQTTGKLRGYTFGSGVTRADVVGATSLSLNTEYHVAMVRQGTTVTLYLNGTSDGSGTQSGTVDTNASVFRIGRNGFNTSRDFIGNMSRFRFTLGHARYTGNFTAPTGAYPQG